MGRHLVLIGGGHAHAALLARVNRITDRGASVTLVSPEPIHYYSGMGPGMLGGSYTPKELCFPIAEMCRDAGVRFVEARVERIDATSQTLTLSTGDSLSYDVLSVNTGSSITPTIETDRVTIPVLPVKPISNLLIAQEHLRARGEEGSHILVAGGGPAAVEIAGNLRRFVQSLGAVPDKNTTIELMTGRAVLPGFPPRVENRVRRCLRLLRINVNRGEYVRRIVGDEVETTRQSIRPDLVLQATGVVPSRLFADSALPTGKDGSLAVNRYLHSLEQKNIFGAGDCIWYTPEPLARAGVFAVRQTPVLATNLERMLLEPASKLRSFAPGGGYLLLLNMGDETAVFVRWVFGIPVVFAGRWAWRLKDRIDRRFMSHILGARMPTGVAHGIE